MKIKIAGMDIQEAVDILNKQPVWSAKGDYVSLSDSNIFSEQERTLIIELLNDQYEQIRMNRELNHELMTKLERALDDEELE